mgnify:CR=1 FL=1
MPRVSQESLKRLKAFIDSLPAEARSKCALCNDTLVHLVKTAEVETGAGTATVTRALADRINEDAAPGDRVSGEALRSKVVTAEHGRRPSEKEKSAQCTNNPQPQHDPAERKYLLGEMMKGIPLQKHSEALSGHFPRGRLPENG